MEEFVKISKHFESSKFEIFCIIIFYFDYPEKKLLKLSYILQNPLLENSPISSIPTLFCL